jgi:DNA (cytosine-5)-methyltransferase 1
MEKNITMYTCDKCGKEFKQKSHYTSHLNRKTPCITDKKLKEYLKVDDQPIEQNNLEIIEEKPKKKFIDLFCGIGGFHQALKSLDLECVFACDIDKNCREVYKKNYGLEPASDITKVDEKTLPNFDIICAGFPCFVAGTKVLTNSNYKNIEDVDITDKLLTHDGNFQKIANIQYKVYEGNLYTINSNFTPNPIICTEEHPFYIIEKRKVFNKNINKYIIKYSYPMWLPIKDITNNDYFGMVINTKSEYPELIQKNTSHWFLLGYFMCSGCIYKENGFIGFLIKEKDEEIFHKINKIIKLSNLECYIPGCKKYYASNVYWNYVLSQFKDNIPEWLQNAPIEYIKEFFNGYHSNKKIYTNGSIQIIIQSYTIAMSLQRLYLKLGYIFKVFKCNDKINPKYCIEGYLLNKLCNDAFIKDNYFWYKSKSIQKNYVEDQSVYNFEVDIDNSYIVENTIVHNCQAFSNAGNKQNFSDKRGMLFEHILRIAVEKKPSFLFLENVKHIKKISDGEVFKHILKRIDESGYYVDENKSIFELSPHQFGIPQHRERVIFVCIRKDIYDKEKVIEIIPPNSPINMEGIIETNINITNKYKISKEVESILDVWDEMVKICETNQNMSPTILCNEFNTIYTPEEFKKLPEWKRDYITKNKDIYKKYKTQWDTWYTKHKELLTKKEIYGKLEWQAGKKKEDDSIWNYFIQLRQSGIRVKKNDYFPTLVAIVQTPIYAKEKRYITPRECARLQAFPDNFIMHESDNIAYKQFGNSVCVDVMKFVMETVLKLYDFI